MLPPLPDIVFEPIVRLALAEDLGRAGDITTDALIPANQRGKFFVRARAEGVIAGLEAAALAARHVDPGLALVPKTQAGDLVRPGAEIAIIEGCTRSILTAERTMLNFIGRLSGVATLTRRYADEIAGTNARIVATRKTTPGMRALEKHAVRLGGGLPHRYGLDDAILIKDNHVAAAGGVDKALERARAAAGHLTPIEVEVDSLAQLEIALRGAPTAILLDNFSLDDLASAVALVNGRVPLEASGNVRLDTVRAIAETGVDYISAGALTHSAPNFDIGLDAD